MALDVASVKVFAELTAVEEQFLSSKERPILLLKKRNGGPLSHLVAPGNQYVGVMLPYTPLHYLLLQPSVPEDQAEGIDNLASSTTNTTNDSRTLPHKASLPVLVMTSGNFSDEPIMKDNDEARRRLAGLADAFLFHDREIHARCDDSVIRIIQGSHRTTSNHRREKLAIAPVGKVLPIRRSRGYAPFPVKLPFTARPLLAVGGELKATFCLTKGNYAYMSQHIGDMENLETLEAFEEAVTHFKHIFRVNPQGIVCDLHPRYLSSQWALQQHKNFPVLSVQHHHAHIASVMAEHQLDGTKPVIGFSFDGTGYGTDGAVWGGEVLIADYQGFERTSFLKYVPLVGGDTAIKRPYRLALAHLRAAGLAWDRRIPSVHDCSHEELSVLEKQIELEINSVPTSSMGRLFDAVASIAGVRQTVTYEAQAAIEFESLANPNSRGSYHFAVGDGEFDAAPVIRAVVSDVLNGIDIGVISTKFHRAVAEVMLQISYQMRESYGLSEVVLSGGVFQNVYLLEQAVDLLMKAGFSVYCHQQVPPNDGGLALGQAAVAAFGYK